MQHFEKTVPPSFPPVDPNKLLTFKSGERWQVVCGDNEHWRVGIYSPAEASRADVKELETHDCPELFLLLSGALTLVIKEKGEVKEIPLELLKPILVTAPHNGYCPSGPGTGVALVVERDRFVTEYRTVEEW